MKRKETPMNEIIPEIFSEPSLAERTLEALCSNDIFEANSLQDPDAAIEVLNRAFLQAQADYVATDCAVFRNDTGSLWWSGTINGSGYLFSGELPPEGTLVQTYSPLAGKIFIAEHRQ